MAIQGAPQNGASPAQYNAYARDMVLRQSILSTLQLPAVTRTAAEVLAGANVINFTPQNVGIVKGFWVSVSGTLQNTGGSQATRTGRGLYNSVSNFTYTDLNVNQRINTTGYHVGFFNTAKLGWAFGSAYTQLGPAGYGQNFPINTSTTTIAATNGTLPFQVWFYIPLAYSATDLTGALFAQTTGGVQNLQVTINNQVGFTTADSLNAMFGGASTAVTWATGTSVTVQVFQEYWNQIPQDPNTGAYIVPLLDVGTSYQLLNTVLPNPTVNQDFPFQYANYRKFLSNIVIFNNTSGSNGEAAFGTGTDITYFKLTTANYTPIWEKTPNLIAEQNRIDTLQDMPLGTYYINHRADPINTNTYGNMQLIIRPSTVNAAAYFVYLMEVFADSAIVSGAGSLPGG